MTHAVPDASRSVTAASDFIPLRVHNPVKDDGPALLAGLPPTAAVGASAPGRPPRPGPDDRPGVIEIELADNTRRRVDAFSNEQERRRVPAMLGVVRMGIVGSAKIWRPVRGV